MEQQQLSLDTFDEAQLDAFTPFNIIRTETVLSRLPVHNLSKKGKIDIRIVRRTEGGDLHLKWEVSHSDRYGQPRQLAYKLDTLIVNRRLDEEERPLPTVIRVGSLKAICKDLGLHESGKNTKDLRTAFLQNATAFINAHLSYRGTDGTERRLEAGFTRYGVVFTGEKLPDGRQADAVYITLNQPYWEVVNSAPVRPLNYDYLKELTPAAQRFYEVVSFRIFAALKNNRPQARLLYSDYCTFSAQKRYSDHEHFRVQMYKIHKPHFDSGYLKSVSIDPATDGEGQPDWMMLYSPGPKARAEFSSFAPKQKWPEAIEPAPPALPGLEEKARGVENKEGQGSEVDETLLQALIDRGIAEGRARKLLDHVSKEQHVVDQLEWADSVIRAAKSGTFRNPPGFYFSLIRDNLRPPDTFESSRKRNLNEETARAHHEKLAQQQEFEHRYEEYRREDVARHVSAIPAEEFQALAAAKRKEYARQYRHLPPETLDELGVSGARADIEKTLPLLTFEEFVDQAHSGPKDQKGQNAQEELFE
jgi:hypothetical protein